MSLLFFLFFCLILVINVDCVYIKRKAHVDAFRGADSGVLTSFGFASGGTLTIDVLSTVPPLKSLNATVLLLRAADYQRYQTAYDRSQRW